MTGFMFNYEKLKSPPEVSGRAEFSSRRYARTTLPA